MDAFGISDLYQDLLGFVAVLEQWVPVVVGLACFVGLSAMVAVAFVRARP